MADPSIHHETSASAWAAMMALYLSAKSDADEFERDRFGPLCDERSRIWPDIARCVRERSAQDRWGQQRGFNEAAEQMESLIDVLCEREDALMSFPAPDTQALVWKLDKLLEPDVYEGSTPCWNKAYARQTIEDYRRLLTGQAS